MKSTLKALKYSFKLLNRPLTYGMLAFSLIFMFAPIFHMYQEINEYKSDPCMYSFWYNDMVFACIYSVLWVWIMMSYVNERIGNCKYNYSVNFARKLYTVVPAIYSFFAITLLFGIVVCIAAVKLGSEYITAKYIMISVGITFLGVASSVSGKRKTDAIVPYILGFLIIMAMCFLSDRIPEIAIPASVVIMLSFIIIAAGFVFSCWYLNYLWDKGVRFVKQKYGFERTFGGL